MAFGPFVGEVKGLTVCVCLFQKASCLHLTYDLTSIDAKKVKDVCTLTMAALAYKIYWRLAPCSCPAAMTNEAVTQYCGI